MTPPEPLLDAPLGGLAIVLGLMVVLMVVVRGIQVLAKPHPELVRKMFHVGGGLVVITLPWLFARPWPVVVLGAVSAGGFLLLRIVPPLKASLGQVLGGVQRVSTGEFGFLAAVVLLFVLSDRAPVLFGVPVLILAIADASAALVGISYGKLHFATVEGGRKSAEGSLTFLVAAFFCVHVPLLLWTTTGRAESLLIAANVALIAMMAEAIAWRGFDNFFIPFFAFAFLTSYLRMGVSELGLHLGVLVGLFAFAYVLRRRTNLVANARLGGVLFGYVAWSLGGAIWLAPPVLLFSLYRPLSRPVARDASRHIHFPAISAVLVPPLLWVVCHWLFAAPGQPHGEFHGYFHAYAAMFGAHLAIIALLRHKHLVPAVKRPALVAVNAAKGALLIVPPAFLQEGFTARAALTIGAGVASIVVACAAFCVLQPELEADPIDTPRWIRQGACVTVASLLSLLPAQADVIARFVAAGP